ncbi:MAG TPA: arginase family protein [Solirubrobacteraceae bacterium]|nr:arginase family protein [Solirubrobacteraceae bacterium]
MDRPLRVTCLRARTSDRTDGAGAGAEALARALGGRVVGEASAGAPRDWSEDLPAARPVLEAAAAEVSAALDQGELPLLTASDCTICIATLPTAARRLPGLRVLWLDAHGDFNTPDTTPSGFLGGMCLAAACGCWDAGWPDTLDPAAVSFLGVRDLDPGERIEVDHAGVGTGVPGDGPVFVHLDLDVLDPTVLAPQFPVPDGLQAAEVRDVLARLRDEGRLVGLEVTALEDPAGVDLVTEILEPVTR